MPLSATWPVKYRHCSRRSVRSFSSRRAARPVVADRQGKPCEGMLRHRSNAFQRFTILFARFTACPFLLSRFSSSFSTFIVLLSLCSEFILEDRSFLPLGRRKEDRYNLVKPVVSFIGVWGWRRRGKTVFNCKSMRREREFVMRGWLLLAMRSRWSGVDLDLMSGKILVEAE